MVNGAIFINAVLIFVLHQWLKVSLTQDAQEAMTQNTFHFLITMLWYHVYVINKIFVDGLKMQYDVIKNIFNFLKQQIVKSIMNSINI